LTTPNKRIDKSNAFYLCIPLLAQFLDHVRQFLDGDLLAEREPRALLDQAREVLDLRLERADRFLGETFLLVGGVDHLPSLWVKKKNKKCELYEGLLKKKKKKEISVLSVPIVSLARAYFRLPVTLWVKKQRRKHTSRDLFHAYEKRNKEENTFIKRSPS